MGTENTALICQCQRNTMDVDEYIRHQYQHPLKSNRSREDFDFFSAKQDADISEANYCYGHVHSGKVLQSFIWN